MAAEHLHSLLLALAIFATGFLVIGPNILAIIGTSMARGRRDGIQLATGIGVGSGIWATLTVVGLVALITAYAWTVLILKLFGAAYLAWLAYKAFRSAASSHDPSRMSVMRSRNLVLKGLAIQMTNPKAALQWIAIVGVGLGSQAPVAAGMTLIICATVMSLAGHVLYAVTFSTRPVVAAYDHARRWIEGALGLFFAFASYKLATARI